MRRALLPLLLMPLPCAGEDEVVLRIEFREGPDKGCFGDGTKLQDMDAIEDWLRDRMAKAGKAPVRVVFRGNWSDVHSWGEVVREVCLHVGLPEPEIDPVKETVIRVDVTLEGRSAKFRCGGQEVSDLDAVLKWLKEQVAKAGEERVCIVFRGDIFAIGEFYSLDLFARFEEAGLPSPQTERVPTEEEKQPRVTAGAAPPSGKVFRLEISDEGGLRGPEGETSLREWVTALEAAKGIRPRGLVEHEVVLRVGAKTAWGQVQLVLAAAAASGYYRLFLEIPQGDGWQRVTFRLPVSSSIIPGSSDGILRVYGSSLHHDEGMIVMPWRLRPSDKGPVVIFGQFEHERSFALDAPELRAFAEGHRKPVSRCSMRGAAAALDAPPDFKALPVLRLAALLNEATGMVLMTSAKTPALTEEHMKMRRLPVPAPPEEPEGRRRPSR